MHDIKSRNFFFFKDFNKVYSKKKKEFKNTDFFYLILNKRVKNQEKNFLFVFLKKCTIMTYNILRTSQTYRFDYNKIVYNLLKNIRRKMLKINFKSA